MIDIQHRIRNKKLLDRIVTAEEAAAFIKPDMNVGTSGFTPAGYPKAVPLALAKRMAKEPFQINLWTGASVGKELDGALAEVNGIARRMPYQTNGDLRKSLNSGKVNYFDLHLSESAQLSRYGYLGGKVDVAIVEACAITEEGHLIPTTSMGNTASYVQSADFVIVEINTTQPLELEGMHDVYVPLDPPHRQPIPIVKVDDRIGTTYIPCGIDKIKCIVPCDIGDDVRDFAPIDENSRAMSELAIEFFKHEIKAGRMPKNLLPLQSGVGSVANAVISGFVDSEFKNLEVYTEVIQDGMLDLADAGKLKFASGTSFSPSPEGQKRLYANIDAYRQKMVLRPQEIANSPEVARRIGIIAMNTAIEFDIYGHVNSTHIMGSKMMNGIGGSGDFARNAYLTLFFSTSVAKGGLISSVVPMCSHIDHTEHDVDVFITERGLADVRGLSPRERARVIIDKCAHPDYQPMLQEYLDRAEKATRFAHTPHLLDEALSWHVRFMQTGSMKK
ncbi:Succinyl-CoA:coenzyme A transferase [Propionispora sp. 2/2-37]|uniref:acetyl-CoA hydrolase/transferase family protein n=1 Tax=Propionispora sp. 2/2-37 TaxID=1677858 RepID=UPI0006BB66A5|nr:acetyl-CoA hydrolase/transferase family protein [Propionispora sp. 2/2-37]CUH93978.1 Succinyl-CoA:coenzyme A transferase [Propionispora sp. 2/2-37]